MTRYEVLNVGLLLESPLPKDNQSDKQKNERLFSKSLIIKKKTSADKTKVTSIENESYEDCKRYSLLLFYYTPAFHEYTPAFDQFPAYFNKKLAYFLLRKNILINKSLPNTFLQNTKPDKRDNTF